MTIDHACCCRGCRWVVGSHELEALGVLMCILKIFFCLIVANLLCFNFCLHLFDIIIELHAMVGKAFSDVFIGSESGLFVIKVYFVCVVKAYHIKLKIVYKYTSPFSSMLLVCTIYIYISL